MRILVCGSRSFTDADIIDTILCGYSFANGGNLTIIEGDARGADRIAQHWAASRSEIGLETFPADWDRYGKGAGHVRNRQMLDEGKPDVVLAFIDKPLVGSKGTLNMVSLAKEAGVPTYVIEARKGWR